MMAKDISGAARNALAFYTLQRLLSLIQGGTGSFSSDRGQPEILPDKYESGTPNLAGIAGLSEGVKFVLNRTPQGMERYEMRLAARLYDRLSSMDRVRLYSSRPESGTHVPVISFNVGDMDSETAARLLDERQIAVRAGLHCAPLAHESRGTAQQGTVRAVMSVFNNERQIDYLAAAVKKIVNNQEKKVAIINSNVLK